MFVIYDDKNPGEALAVYLDSRALRKHNVSAEKFEVAFRALPDLLTEVLANALAEAIVGPSEGKRDQKASSRAAQYELRFGLTEVAFQEILETARMEDWVVNPDGTHTVKKIWSPKASMSQNQNVLAGGKSSDVLSSQDEEKLDFYVPPTTLEQAQVTFTEDTGITWPDLASDVKFDENRVPLLGDGSFYVVFTVPPKLLQSWLESQPPWEVKEWLQGPVPAEVGCHCGFGFQSPHGWSAVEGGPKEYSGGAAEILEILKSEAVRYVARNRGPKGNPWYNGDLLILDPRTGVVRYCS